MGGQADIVICMYPSAASWWRPVGTIKATDIWDMRLVMTDVIRVLVLGHYELDKRTSLPVVSTEDFLQVELA